MNDFVCAPSKGPKVRVLVQHGLLDLAQPLRMRWSLMAMMIGGRGSLAWMRRRVSGDDLTGFD
jgi:hypothetical protein